MNQLEPALSSEFREISELTDFPAPLRDRFQQSEICGAGPSFKKRRLVVFGKPHVWGGSEDLSPRVRIGVIGTRKPSSYGRAFVCELMRALRKLPVVIVSGGALGIDGEAHAEALRNQLPTEAWLVGPILNPNPRSHGNLFREMSARPGCALVVPSALEPILSGRNPIAPDWLQRNQWLSLSVHVLVVVEAGIHSGTWSTVKFASKNGIPVWALPGSIFSESASGTNAMISRGYAHPIESVGFLLDAFIAELRSNLYTYI